MKMGTVLHWAGDPPRRQYSNVINTWSSMLNLLGLPLFFAKFFPLLLLLPFAQKVSGLTNLHFKGEIER
jgi:hypothetical protein